MAIYTYLPQDRLRAIANNTSLPGRTSGSALFADISGFTALTESLRDLLGARQGAEELTQLLGAVESALKALGAVVEATILPLHTQTLTAAREQLGEAAFQSAWEEGGQWSLEEAVTFALKI